MRVLKLDISGVPESWISLEEAVGYYATDTVAYTLGDAMTTFHGGHNHFGSRSTIELHPIIAVSGESVAGRLLAATPRLTQHNHKLFRRDRYTCAYCGVDLPRVNGAFEAREALARYNVTITSNRGLSTGLGGGQVTAPSIALEGTCPRPGPVGNPS